MRHAREVGDDRFAADGLAEADRQLALHLFEVGAGQHLAQIDGFARFVGQFDADGVAAGHDGDAGGDRAHRAGDVVGQRDDAARFDAGRGLEFVERHHRAGADIDDVALDAEVLEHAFETAGHGFEALGTMLLGQAAMLGFGQEAQFGQFEARFVDEQRSLGLAGSAVALRRAFCGRGDARTDRGEGFFFELFFGFGRIEFFFGNRFRLGGIVAAVDDQLRFAAAFGGSGLPGKARLDRFTAPFGGFGFALGGRVGAGLRYGAAERGLGRKAQMHQGADGDIQNAVALGFVIGGGAALALAGWRCGARHGAGRRSPARSRTAPASGRSG